MVEKIESKTVKVVVLNGFRIGTMLYKRGDVATLTEHQAKSFSEYPGVRPEHVYVKPLDKVSKEELAALNKVTKTAVDKAPSKEEKSGKSK